MDPFKNNTNYLKSMSEQEKNNELDSLWEQYTKSLENWKSLFEQIQNASNDMQSKFNEVWDKATVESSAETMKLFGENWQKTLSSSGLEQMQAYGDTMKKFAETWNSMWPRSQ